MAATQQKQSFDAFRYLFLIYVTTTSFATISSAVLPPYVTIAQMLEEYKLPELEYGYEELQPLLDGETLRVHHTGHHAAYTQKMNVALREWRNDENEDATRRFAHSPIVNILQSIDQVPEKYRTVLRNNGGGFVNHNLYWSGMSANPQERSRSPKGELKNHIDRDFGDFQKFQEAFTEQAKSLFGSGYVWLSKDPRDGKLVITKTANQNSAISENLHPILVLDVWEHAYYLKHQNKRPKYIDDWWLLVDWSKVEALDQWWISLFGGHDEL